MMSREWVKDTREAWERAANEALRRAGCGERIDHRSLAERRDEAERAGDLEQAAELSEKRGIPPRAAHPPTHQLAHHPKSLVYRIQQAPGYLYGQ